MVSLYIDGTPVVLPSDFATEIKIENSFFTKNGEYTYDFKIPLNNPTNAALYSHLHRLNNVSEVKEKRQAVLIADNRCFINGTEIITDWTEDSVSIQLASGNSELNYLIGADLQVSFLDMDSGITEDERFTGFESSIACRYPDSDYVSAPFSTPNGIRNGRYILRNNTTYSLDRVKNTSNRRILPYLCALVRRILSALGYTIGVNQLEESRYSQLIVVHDINTFQFSKMLPGWSVKNFFENLERMFNLVLVVNNRNRMVDVVFANQFYIASEEVYLSAVEDDYEVETDEGNAMLMTNANVNYDLPDSEYFRYARMNDSLVNLCEKVEQPSLLNVGLYFKENTPNRTICIDTSTGRQYVYRPYKLTSFQGGMYPLREVNQYAMLDRGGEDIDLKFVPCAQVPYLISCYEEREKVGEYMWLIPAIDDSSSSGDMEDTSDMNITELIESGQTDNSEKVSGRLFLAFWHGCQGLLNALGPNLPIGYPLAMSDNMFQWITEEVELEPRTMVGSEYSLRLPVLDAELYNGVYDIDTTKSYKFYTSDPNLPDAHLIFVIRNKRFVCREMNFSIAQGEKQKRWSLTCYPIHIGDAEAYKRWILTDGRWRDGGVWLDDGRWLDE